MSWTKKFLNSLHPIPCIFVGEQHILASALSVYSHSHWLVNFFTTDSSLVLTRERWQNFGHFRIFFPEHPVPKTSSSSLTRQEHFGLCNVSVIVQVHGLKGTHKQFFKTTSTFFRPRKPRTKPQATRENRVQHSEDCENRKNKECCSEIRDGKGREIFVGRVK